MSTLTDMETSGIIFKGFYSSSGSPAGLNLVLVYEQNPSTDTDTLSPFIKHSLDAGTTWTTDYSGPGNDLTGLQTLTISLSPTADLTQLWVWFEPAVAISSSFSPEYRLFNIYEVYVEETS